MTLEIHDYIQPGRTAHLVGIGGVSMSPLAEVLHGAGVRITGSDVHESAAVEHLRALGGPGDHRPPGRRAWRGRSCVIRTAAVHDCQPGDRRRPAGWASPSSSGPRPGGPSCGTTTTPCASRGPTARPPPPLCAPTSFMAAGLDPTVMIGGTLPLPWGPATGWATGTPSFWSPVSTATPSSPSSPPWR